jgi:hypothetical protein
MTKLCALIGLLTGCMVGEVGTGGGGGGIDASSSVDSRTPDAPVSGASLQLTFTTTPTPGGGQYAPANVVAVWIENQGTFVKTVGRWAETRKQHLVAWTLAAGPNDADAVTGATRANNTLPLTVTWNLQNRLNTVVPDGTYTVRMELTDLNSNAANLNNQGTFTFIKGPAPQMQTALTNGGFTNVSIQFTP